jgi:hypothetical protein
MSGRRRRQQPEAELQRACIQHLQLRGAKGVVPFAIPNGGLRSKVEAAIMRATGTLAGMPDLGIVHRGQIFFIELKTETGKPSARQSAVMDGLRLAGATVAIAYGLDDALRQLEEWGLLRGTVMLERGK